MPAIETSEQVFLLFKEKFGLDGDGDMHASAPPNLVIGELESLARRAACAFRPFGPEHARTPPRP